MDDCLCWFVISILKYWLSRAVAWGRQWSGPICPQYSAWIVCAVCPSLTCRHIMTCIVCLPKTCRRIMSLRNISVYNVVYSLSLLHISTYNVVRSLSLIYRRTMSCTFCLSLIYRDIKFVHILSVLNMLAYNAVQISSLHHGLEWST
jgi:hypothetical protein